ncbi:MAG: archaellin/type IV pilin N-terminal domain-containing protein [Candidatus Thermoplasmatota archaeon]
MKEKYMKRLIGTHCKIVTKEPGDKRASVVTGILEDIDYEDGFILVDSEQGLGCLSIETIVAIKPGSKKNKPKHKKRKIKKDEHAAIGIGTLIVFIAMVLVAAVAASVIIQTSENLQNRAQAVGKQTIREVSTGLKIVGMTGYTNEDRTRVQYLALNVRPRAGSYDIDMNNTQIHLEHTNLTILSLDYTDDNAADGGSISGSVSSDGVFHTLNHSCLSSKDFGLVALRDSDGSITDSYGLGTSDSVMVIINLSAAFPETNGLEPNKEVRGRIIPEVGASGIFFVSTPNTFPHRVVSL